MKPAIDFSVFAILIWLFYRLIELSYPSLDLTGWQEIYHLIGVFCVVGQSSKLSTWVVGVCCD